MQTSGLAIGELALSMASVFRFISIVVKHTQKGVQLICSGDIECRHPLRLAILDMKLQRDRAWY